MKGSVWPKLSISLRFPEIGPFYAKLQLSNHLLPYRKHELIVS